jgi:hypothetical protein
MQTNLEFDAEFDAPVKNLFCGIDLDVDDLFGQVHATPHQIRYAPNKTHK